KGVYIEVDDDELEAIQVESKHTVDIDSFVPAAQIDKRFYDSPYYIAPTDSVGQEAFAVIRDAMRGKGMVALGRIVLAKREHVIALEPCGKGMLGTTLRYAYEVRKPEEYFSDIEDIKVPGEMLKLAEHILDTKAGDFDPTAFEDHYETALVELLRKKQAGFKPPKTKEHVAAPRNVINLMDALRRSVQAESAAPAQAKKGSEKCCCRSRASRRRSARVPRNRARAAKRADLWRAGRGGLRRCHCVVPIAGGRRLISQPESQFADTCVRDMPCWPPWSCA